MASNKSSLPIAEPLCFHQIHGEQIRLSQNNTRATRERLNHNLVFTNRPIFPNEVLVFHVEEVSDQFHGIIRIALTTIDPETFRQQPPPRSIPINDNREWFVPSPRGSPFIRKDHPIRFKYTTEGDIYVDYEGNGFTKYPNFPPIVSDVWCALDLNGGVSQIRLGQEDVRVMNQYTDRAIDRVCQYTNNHQQRNVSIYYAGQLQSGQVSMNDCDEECEVVHYIAVRKPMTTSSSMIVEEILQRTMYMVVQILDMDHTFANYLTIRCLTNHQPSATHTAVIDRSVEHLTVGDELGIRVQPDGQITFSCNNRHIKPLFTIDLTANDNPQVRPTRYYLQFVMNARVTALRLVGLHRPTEAEARRLPVTVHGGCEATVVKSVCPNRPSGLLLPCKHLCVCYDCGQALINRHHCPKVNCRKPVTGCIKVYRD